MSLCVRVRTEREREGVSVCVMGLQELLCLRLGSKGKHNAEAEWRGKEKVGK